MPPRTAKAGDWIAIAAEQATACRSLHGVQKALGPATVPFTPGTFALMTFRFWNAAVDTAMVAAAKEGKFDAGLAEDLAGVLAGLKQAGGKLLDVVTPSSGGLFMTQMPKTMSGRVSSLAVKQSLGNVDTALRVMLDAMAKGGNPGARNAAGLLCLSAVEAPRFWSSVATLGRECSFLFGHTSVTVDEYWSTAKEAVKEAAKDVLRAVGETAGAALKAAGEGVGAGARGFFEGLGVVNTVVIVAGGVIALKVL